MTVRFPVDRGYPIEITADKVDGTIVANNEAELIQSLERVFQSAGAVSTVRQLISLLR